MFEQWGSVKGGRGLLAQWVMILSIEFLLCSTGHGLCFRFSIALVRHAYHLFIRFLYNWVLNSDTDQIVENIFKFKPKHFLKNI